MQAATTLPTGNGTVTFENSVVVRRRASEVFDYLADLENIPRWNYAIAVSSSPPSAQCSTTSALRSRVIT